MAACFAGFELNQIEDFVLAASKISWNRRKIRRRSSNDRPRPPGLRGAGSLYGEPKIGRRCRRYGTENLSVEGAWTGCDRAVR